MDKAVIFGAYEFVGFHVCKRLLDEGYEVKGIHFYIDQSDMVAEKRMEIGRNANFQEQSVDEWLKAEQKGKEKLMILISLYDWYIGCKDSVLADSEWIEKVEQFLRKRKDQQDMVALLLPIQLLANENLSKEEEEIRKCLEKISKHAEARQYFYLPSVYGPWQPPTCLFQKLIEDGACCKPSGNCNYREWRQDVFFIDDLLDPIYQIIESGKNGHYLFESGEQRRWEECLEQLNYKQECSEKGLSSGSRLAKEAVRITVGKLTSVAESLTRQKEHFKRTRQE